MNWAVARRCSLLSACCRCLLFSIGLKRGSRKVTPLEKKCMFRNLTISPFSMYISTGKKTTINQTGVKNTSFMLSLCARSGKLDRNYIINIIIAQPSLSLLLIYIPIHIFQYHYQYGYKNSYCKLSLQKLL